MGHTVKRCKQPIKEDAGAADGKEDVGFDTADTNTGGGGWDGGAAATGGSANNDWENAASATPVAVAVADGGW